MNDHKFEVYGIVYLRVVGGKEKEAADLLQVYAETLRKMDESLNTCPTTVTEEER